MSEPAADDLALPHLVPGQRGPGHTKRCHLADPETIYRTEILPEIAPDLVEEH